MRSPISGDQAFEIVDLRGMKAGRRLVHDDEMRIESQRPRKLDEALMARRQGIGSRVEGAVVADEREQISGLRKALSFLSPEARRSKQAVDQATAELVRKSDHHVLQNGQFAEKAGGLKSAGDAATGDLVWREPRDHLVSEANAARGRGVVAAQHVQQHGLARAVRPDQCVDRAGGNREADPLERLHAAERHAYVMHLHRQQVGARVSLEQSDAAGARRGVRPRRAQKIRQRRLPRKQRADEAARKSVKGNDNQSSVDDEPIVGKLLQHLRQERDDRGAGDWTQDRSRAAEDDARQEDDGRVELERFRADEALQESEEMTRQAHQHRAHDKGHGLDALSAEAGRFRGDRVLPHRHETAPPRGTKQVADQERHKRGQCDDDRELLLQRKPLPEHRGPRNIKNPLRAARQVGPLDQCAVDDDAEGDRHHRKIGAFQLERR